MTGWEHAASEIVSPRDAFLSTLKAGIATLPPGRVREIEEDMLRHFAEGLENGENEEQLVEKLGDPAELAREYVELYSEEVPPTGPLPSVWLPEEQEDAPEPVTVSYEPLRKRGGFSMAAAAVGMFFFNLILGLPLWITLGTVWIVLACGFIMVPAGILAILIQIAHMIMPLPWVQIDYPLVNFFGAISVISLGGLMIMGCIRYGKILVRWMTGYLRFNRRAVTGRRES